MSILKLRSRNSALLRSLPQTLRSVQLSFRLPAPSPSTPSSTNIDSSVTRGFSSLRGDFDYGRRSSLLPKEQSPSAVQAKQLNPAGIRNFSSTRRYDFNGQNFGFAKKTALNWGLRVVPQQEAFVIERFGKFSRVLDPGLHVLIPFVDRIAYIHSLKEEAIPISYQAAVTADNVTLQMDGILYVKIVDPYKASYGVGDPLFAITQLAQTSMRSAIGRMTLDKTFFERETLNVAIVEAIDEPAQNWGLLCLRYEIRDITIPPGVRETMEMQAEAERRKRAMILEAEGKRQSEILAAEANRQAIILSAEANRESVILGAEANRQSVILASEAAKLDFTNRAEGEADALRMMAEAKEHAIRKVANAMIKHGGSEAASLTIADQYMQAFSKLAKESTTVLLPTSASEPASMISQALAIYRSMNGQKSPVNQSSNNTLIEDATSLKGSGDSGDGDGGDDDDDDSLTSGMAETDDTEPQTKPVFSLQKKGE